MRSNDVAVFVAFIVGIVAGLAIFAVTGAEFLCRAT
jgi:hypothetical protein